MTFLTAVLAFAVAIGILVVAHEYGHYAVARLCGVKVLRFSIGFGKPIATWRGKSGTEWSIGPLPLGGYVKMLDERESDEPIPAEDLPHAFNRKSVARRFAIVAAGPIANFLLAIVLFAGLYATGVSEPVPMLGVPAAGTVAARAGFAGGETVVAVRDAEAGGEHAVRSWTELRWKLVDAALAHKPIVLRATMGNRTFDYPVDLSHVQATEVDDNLLDRIGFTPGGAKAVVASVEPGSPAAAAGLREGDRLVGIDDAKVVDVNDFITRVQSRAGQTLTLAIERDGKVETVPVFAKPTSIDVDGQAKTVGRIGAALGAQMPMVDVRYGPIDAVTLGVRRTWDISAFSVRMFGKMIVGEASLKNLSGPVTIADYAGKSASLGLASFVSFLALISISLGVLNLLPIPILDGGHLLYYSVEAVTGKAVPERWQLVFQRAGIVCILVLSAIALFNDLARLLHS
ncbi:RIP metalloprotease RseP [Pararobbsia silviterrae]|uniref:Zinc metalloprotease n=1 Tax=Pararobbsia silviterrae TaxID=1792498 RepID=A0A494Y030_9BURK|nr:RIP metalloprotease RseP [Pararobbsia silviterrae]RKP54659.1 RIP metalloprotease RseP [Pararobbsia silviterrae]